jgi:hydrogenase maturation protease
VFIVDAVSSGAAQGAIHRFDATREQLRGQVFHHSTHAFGLKEGIELARALNRLPPRLVIYGIEGKCFSIGERISTEVMEACSRVVDRILAESGSRI